MSLKNIVNQYDDNINLLTGGFDIEKYSKDKKTIADTIGATVLNLMQSAFEWKNLPDTIPQKWLEVMLMRCGYCVVTEVDGNLYALWGGLGGEYDEYYQPTIVSVANPWLKYSANVEIKDDKEGVLVSNDTLRRGLLPLIGKYAGLLAENTVTMRIADIMARTTNIISGGDESTIESAKEYLRQLEKGELGVIQESAFLEDLKVQAASTSAHSQITDLIELEQYLKASLLNQLGLQANYNMKREAINSNEAQLNDDATRPFIEDMLMMRQDAARRINERYGTDISVDYSGVWKEKQEENAAALESETMRPEEGGDNGEEETDGSNEIMREDSENVPEGVETGEEAGETPDGMETEEAKPALGEDTEAGTEAGGDVEAEISVENAETVIINNEVINDGNSNESDDPDSISGGGDPDESEEPEDGGVADSDDDGSGDRS